MLEVRVHQDSQAKVAVKQTTVQNVVDCIDTITGGRLSTFRGDINPWAVVKDSGIIGKSVREMPGLVWGDLQGSVGRLGVAMTLSEHHIELAHAIGVDAILTHHPVADGASSGGVPIRDYLSLYGIALLECHEAFHGLHPGIGYIHGHHAYYSDPAYQGKHGVVVTAGRPLPGVETIGDIFDRLDHMLERDMDRRVLAAEREIRNNNELVDSLTSTGFTVLHGELTSPLGSTILHVFPHTGIDQYELDCLLSEHPDAGTLLLSISSSVPHSSLVRRAAQRGLNVVVGSTHPSELLENGMPLSFALSEMLPAVDVFLFRDRVVATPITAVPDGPISQYGKQMASEHLIR